MKEKRNNILTETHNINISHPNFKELDMLCFNVKNLYNTALYHSRKLMSSHEPVKVDFLHSYNFLDMEGYYKIMKDAYQDRMYYDFYFMDKYLKTKGLDKEYRSLPSTVAQQTLKKLEKNFKSYFSAIKDYKTNKGKYKSRPKPPKYLEKDGRLVAIYSAQNIIKNKWFEKGKVKLSGLDILIPFINKRKNTLLLEVRVIPINKENIKIELIYDNLEVKSYNSIKSLYAGIDLGIVNNITMTYLNIDENNSNKSIQPIIVRSSLTTINQFYNKKLALYKSELPKGVLTSKKIQKLTIDRNNKIKNEMHNISSFIVKELYKNKVDTLCIGYTEGWKQKINVGKKNNQNFVQLPFHILISQIEYKCKNLGINTICTEESYTSQSSFLDLDDIPKYDKNNNSKYTFSGKRSMRGLYISKNNIKINADVNGSYNQIRKATPTVKYNQRMLEGVLVSPIVFRIGKSEPVTHVRVISNENYNSNIYRNDLISNVLSDTLLLQL